MKSKYLIIEDKGLEIPILFSPLFKHNEVLGGKMAVSAGFCRIKSVNPLVVETWGNSVGLNLNSRPEDKGIIVSLLEYSI